jgi:hypothetical protein
MSIFQPTTFFYQQPEIVTPAGPSPVLSGLTVYVDAGNTTSYNGSGATWYDLSGNANNCTLVNSPTFTSGTSGYFQLNGTDQYVRVPVGLNTTAYTIQVIVMSTVGAKAQRTFMSCDTTSGIGSGAPYRDMYWTTTTVSTYAQNSGAVTLSNTYNLNQWYGFALTQASATQQGYRDDTQTITNRTGMQSIGDNESITVGVGYWGYSNMRVAAILIYNRQLSSTEITQNYDYFNTNY